MMMLGIDLTGRPVTVVGGGRVAERKVRRLLEAGAVVRVISPSVTAGITESGVQVVQRPFAPGDTEAAWLVVAATGIAEVDARVAAEARAAGRLVSVSGAPALGDTHFVAEVRRGPVTLGIATGGASPAIARRLRQEVERQVGPEWGVLAGWLAAVRDEVKAALPPADRAPFYAALVDGPLLDMLAAGDEAGARAWLEAQLAAARRNAN